jgi:crotonobetaine/carnitine-CoA ligase
MPAFTEDLRQKARFWAFLAGLARNLVRVELEKGTLLSTLLQSARNRTLSVAEATLMGDLLERRAAEHPQRTLLLYGDRVLSYRDLDVNSNRVAHGLLGCGLSPGDGVAIMMRNCPEFLDVFYATQKTGMYAVPVNVSLKGDGLVHILQNSGSRALVIDHICWDSFAAVSERLPSIRVVIADRSEAPGDFEPKGPLEELGSFYDAGLPKVRPEPRPRRGDPAVLMYTSGTTGLPKAVAWRYGDSRVELIGVLARSIFKSDDNLYTCAPLFHANALFITCLSAIFVGAKVTLSRRFSARSFWEEQMRYRTTSFNAMGSMMEILMMQPPSPFDRQNDVRLVMAAAITPETWERFEDRYGVTVWNAYGAVDSGRGIIMNVGNAPRGSLGRPVAVKCRVVTEEGRPAAPGETGELQMFLGREKQVEYYGDEEATQAKVGDGWLRTGDMVVRDRKGNFYYMGRDIERIRRRGENVTCFDVEREIMKHDSVEEVAVYGVPSELGEDEVMAAVVPREGAAISPEELIEFLQDKLAPFQMPRFIRLLDELPKTEVWKVKKKGLQAEGVTADAWDREKDSGKIRPGRGDLGPGQADDGE